MIVQIKPLCYQCNSGRWACQGGIWRTSPPSSVWRYHCSKRLRSM